MASETKILYAANNKAYDDLKRQLSNHSSFILFTDDNTDRLCKSLFLDSLNLSPKASFSFLPGETNKTIAHVEEAIQAMLENSMDRNSAVVNLGGGIVTDMGGFAASIFKRGISYYNVPTSLLSMVDASFGGKTGVNVRGIKNQVGVFKHPEITLIDQRFLETLPEMEINSAFAEILKHALIASPDYWQELKDIDVPKDITDLETIIRKSVEIKNKIVERDPEEKGDRKLLNFGHSIGHAIEAYLSNSTKAISHGHAVALGMLVESYISVQMSLIGQNDFQEIGTVIRKIYPILELSTHDFEKIMDLLQHDKKNEDEAFNFTLLMGIGKGKVDCFPGKEVIAESLEKSIGGQ